MQRLRALIVFVTAVLLSASCATRMPAAHTFSAASWSPVQQLKPGTWLRVRYVGGTPQLRRSFHGTLVAAGPDVLELETSDGVQRLLPNRVLQVAIVDPKGDRVLPAAAIGAFLGALGGGLQSVINEKNDASTKRTTITAGVIAGLIGAAIGHAIRGPRPVIVYSRNGSL